MLFPWRLIQSLLHMTDNPPWTGSTAARIYQDAIDIPTHAIIHHLNASGVIASLTTNVINADGMQFTKTFIDLDTWQSAAAAVVQSNSDFTLVADKPPIVPASGTTADDTFRFHIYCTSGVKLFGVREMTHFAWWVQGDVTRSALPGWYEYILVDQDTPNDTIRYTIMISEWVNEMGGMLINNMYNDMMFDYCDNELEKTAGGISWAWSVERGRFIIATEVAAGVYRG
jgi:hypothetical protein